MSSRQKSILVVVLAFLLFESGLLITVGNHDEVSENNNFVKENEQNIRNSTH